MRGQPRSFADQLQLLLPAVLALLLILLSAMPLRIADIALAPNVAFLMSLILAVAYPPAWPLGLAFGCGLLQDVLSGTPLGSQALIAMALTVVARRNARRLDHQPLRVRWMEAAATLLVAYFLLWLVLRWVLPVVPPLQDLLVAAVISAAWFPVFFLLIERGLVLLLPPRN